MNKLHLQPLLKTLYSITMRLLIPIFFVLSSIPLLSYDEEVLIVQELIKATQNNLKAQNELLSSLIKFKQARQAFIEDPTSRKLATLLVKTAMAVQNQIENEHLAHLFSQDFLSEIQFYNQLGMQQKP